MDVIRHQAIGVKKKGSFGFLRSEEVKKLEIVVMVSEYLFTVVSAAYVVVKTAADLNTGQPRHS